MCVCVCVLVCALVREPECYQSCCSLRELKSGGIVLLELKGASRVIVLCSLGEEYTFIGELSPMCLFSYW